MGRWAEVSEPARATEDRTKHGVREPPSVCVLQRRMEAGDDVQTAGQGVLCAVNKGKTGAHSDTAGALQMSQQTIECDTSEADNNAKMLEEGNLLVEPGRAVAQFLWCGLVRGWCSTPNRGDPKIGELHTVIARCGVGLRGKARFMQNRIQEIPGAVTREWATCPVGTMRAGCQAQDEDARLWVAKRRHRAAPVLPLGVGSAARCSHLRTMCPQAGAECAEDDARIERLQGIGFGAHGGIVGDASVYCAKL